MNAALRLSLVIATKDRAEYLRAALDSLAAQQGAPPFEAVVVDNASTDATAQVVEAAGDRLSFPVRYAFEPEPNRGKARNRGVAAASGAIVVFCDDDVALPPGFLAAHDRAHDGSRRVVSGPILNVASYAQRPAPRAANYSGAFLCTCNASMPRDVFDDVGGFDEAFSLYGWEDTELGVRLRAARAQRHFAWDAYLWHLKPPSEHRLEVELLKATERARMARLFVAKHASWRARMATGAYPANLLRGRFLPEAWIVACSAAATAPRLPAPMRSLARAALLDAVYTRELSRVFAS